MFVQDFKPMHSRKIFGFNITPEDKNVIMLEARLNTFVKCDLYNMI